MKRLMWKWSGLLAVALGSGSVFAQGLPISPYAMPGSAPPPGFCPTPLPAPYMPPATPPAEKTTPQTTTEPSTTPTEQNAQQDQQNQPTDQQQASSGLESLSGAGNGFPGNNTTAAGVGLTSAAGVSQGTTTGAGGVGKTANTMTFVVHGPSGLPGSPSSPGFGSTQLPLILPGLFTAINSEIARPVDRLFFAYGYLSGFQVSSPGGGTVPGFNLNRWDIGAEKTFFDGRASIYVRVPFLWATENSSGQPIDGLADVSAGLKFALLFDKDTGNTLTAGMTVSAPTARDTVATILTFQNNTTQRINASGKAVPANSSGTLATPQSDFNAMFPTQTTTINPTILQPWVSGLLVLDRLFVQDYFSVVIPTDDRVSTFLNNDVIFGYQVWRADCPKSFLSSITPTVDVQVLMPISHQGSPATPASPAASLSGATLNPGPGGTTGVSASSVTSMAQQASPAVSVSSPYQVFITGGVALGLGERSVLSLGVVTPVAGPKAFTTGGVVGLNFFY